MWFEDGIVKDKCEYEGGESHLASLKDNIMTGHLGDEPLLSGIEEKGDKLPASIFYTEKLGAEQLEIKGEYVFRGCGKDVEGVKDESIKCPFK